MKVPISSSSVSRREVLVSALAVAAVGCAQKRVPAQKAAGSASADVPAAAWGGLDMKSVGGMRDDERGGTALVLLHGWRARGDDLVGLAHALAGPKARFFVPAAPLSDPNGGRAWWHLDRRDRPEPASENAPVKSDVHPALKAARAAVQTVLRTIRERYAPDVLCVAGFSQGAMLALDVALAAPRAVDRVAALSGLLLADSVAGLRSANEPRPTVFLSHGREDSIVPFQASERAKQMLERHGLRVTWQPFDGGHEIPTAVVAELRRFVLERT